MSYDASDIILTKWFWQVFWQHYQMFWWTFDKMIWKIEKKTHHFLAQNVQIWWPDMYILSQIMLNVGFSLIYLRKMSHLCLVLLSEYMSNWFDQDDVWCSACTTYTTSNVLSHSVFRKGYGRTITISGMSSGNNDASRYHTTNVFIWQKFADFSKATTPGFAIKATFFL